MTNVLENPFETNTLIETVNAKQDTLISGTSIKTINNQSLLGEGNIVIESGGSNASWGAITGTLSDQTDLQNALNNTVKLTNDQTITGHKEFTEEIIAPDILLLASNNIAASIGYDEAFIYFNSEQNNKILSFGYDSNGSYLDNNNIVLIHETSENRAIAYAPRTINNGDLYAENSNQIVTSDYLYQNFYTKSQTKQLGYAYDNDVVHLANNETITGTKTFSGDGWITYIKNTEVTYNTAPATHVSTAIIFTDKNNTQMGAVECFRHPDNSTLMHFNVYGPNGAWASHDLQLRVASDGTTTAHAPNPPSASNDTNIATTKWVKDQGYIANSSGKITIYSQDGTKFNGFQIAENDNYAFKLLNPNQGANGWWSVTAMTSQSLAKNGYICFNHGLIINWGQYDYADGTDYNVTFSKAFTSTNYQMTFGHELNETGTCDYYGPQIRKGTKTTTGCTVYNRNNDNARTSWVTWIAIGY